MSELFYPGQTVEVEVFVLTEPSALALKGSPATPQTITVYDASRWSTSDVLKIGEGDPQLGPSQLVAISSISGNVVTLASTLLYTFPINTPVYHLADATVEAFVTPPNDTPDEVTMSSVSTGRYRGTYVPSVAGGHNVEATAAGAAVGAGQSRLWVESE